MRKTPEHFGLRFKKIRSRESALCPALRVPGSPETRGAHRSGWPQRLLPLIERFTTMLAELPVFADTFGTI
jgi:hypothetical protein